MLGIFGSPISIYLSWNWFTSWEPVEQHLPILSSIIKEVLMGRSSIWPLYKSYLMKNSWIIDFILHLSIPSTITFFMSTWISFKLLYIPGGRTLDQHIIGVRKIVGKPACHHAKQQLMKECKAGGTPSLYLHPKIQISKQSEVGNILITGKPGSGKTVVIYHILEQLIKRKKRLFIFDEKHEYTAKIFQSSSSILIAPWDKRGEVWNIAEDMS